MDAVSMDLRRCLAASRDQRTETFRPLPDGFECHGDGSMIF